MTYYVSRKAKTNLAERLKQGSIANASRDLQMAEDWFSRDEEAWQPKEPSDAKVGHPRRGDICLVNLDPAIGHEIKKDSAGFNHSERHCQPVQPSTIVAAITSKFDVPPYPTDVIMEPKESGLS